MDYLPSLGGELSTLHVFCHVTLTKRLQDRSVLFYRDRNGDSESLAALPAASEEGQRASDHKAWSPSSSRGVWLSPYVHPWAGLSQENLQLTCCRVLSGDGCSLKKCSLPWHQWHAIQRSQRTHSAQVKSEDVDAGDDGGNYGV